MGGGHGGFGISGRAPHQINPFLFIYTAGHGTRVGLLRDLLGAWLLSPLLPLLAAARGLGPEATCPAMLGLDGPVFLLSGPVRCHGWWAVALAGGTDGVRDLVRTAMVVVGAAGRPYRPRLSYTQG
jgi:hypothetical protein